MYPRVYRPTQPFDHLADGEAGYRSTVDVGNPVVDLESGARGGSVWQNRQDFGRVLGHAKSDSDTAETLACGPLFLGRLGAGVARVLVQS